jgi:enoyl-CoA hydratase/carnithine racemase
LIAAVNAMADLLVDDDGAVRTLTMNRPEKRNALNLALSEALFDALREADGAADIRAIVLTGAGPAFCAGADLSEFAALSSANADLVERRADITAKLHGVFSHLTKPVVTAINGAAMGGGAGLALAGDIAIMSATAKLGYPEVKHGIVASVVMANLVRQAGRKAAFELVATGEPIEASRAVELGLVNRVVAPQMLMHEALQSARAMAAVAPQAMAATKSLFYRVAELPFDEALEAGREMNRRMRAFRKDKP